jgi:hypothetical protein
MFKENLNTAVFTTKFILEGNSPILFVFHFDDGSWQFSGSEENLSDQDYRVVSLEEMIEHDKSIIELATMPINSQATRLNPDLPWRISNKN